MKKEINPRPLVLAGIIVVTGMFRLFVTSGTLSTLANFTPLGAMALFGGCYYHDKWKAYLVPLITLWLTDIILNRYFFFHEWIFFYEGFFWVYASFALMVFIGTCIRRITVKNVVTGAVVAALTHWVVADIGVWLSGGCFPANASYTPTWDTLIETLIFASPSMYKMLVGNILFCGMLFGTFEFMQQKFPALQTAHR